MGKSQSLEEGIQGFRIVLKQQFVRWWRLFLGEGKVVFLKIRRESQSTVKSLLAGKEAQKPETDRHPKKEIIYARYESGTFFTNAPADFETFKTPYSEVKNDRTQTKNKIKE